MSEEAITIKRLRTISKSGWLGTAGETSGMAREIIELRARAENTVVAGRLADAARCLIAENTAVAESSHGPDLGWAASWEELDPENFDAVHELKLWCDAVEALLRDEK